jgi:hypothetical protein
VVVPTEKKKLQGVKQQMNNKERKDDRQTWWWLHVSATPAIVQVHSWEAQVAETPYTKRREHTQRKKQQT